MKLSRIVALACVACLAFASLTAFADVTVVTTTNYDYTVKDSAALMTVTTDVAGAADNAEITYYVSKPGATEEDDDVIVYIDQKTAEDGATQFLFQAAKGDILAATALHGSDKGYTFPTFEFNDGCNYLTDGVAKITETTGAWGVYDEAAKKGTWQGVLSGSVKKYGIKITIDGNEEFLPAMGCDINGVFVIEVNNITAAEAATAVQYVE